MSDILVDVSKFDIETVENTIKCKFPEYKDFKLIIPEWTEKSRKIKKIKMVINNKEYSLNIGNHRCPKVKEIESEIERYKHYINASFIDFLWNEDVEDVEEDVSSNNTLDEDTANKMKEFLEML